MAGCSVFGPGITETDNQFDGGHKCMAGCMGYASGKEKTKADDKGWGSRPLLAGWHKRDMTDDARFAAQGQVQGAITVDLR
ncbi:hypothetical protein GCM10010971_17070 [Silvimonas amylolytica]|uniref:Lipoprotein n=1 Tax=Silvimonas amylolytica TaxID=449663 RepID=A0ABQ2PJV4_9NEIS|nr:hypothetical protein GCM10010971_17070 [Silvimonas amylolytica]